MSFSFDPCQYLFQKEDQSVQQNDPLHQGSKETSDLVEDIQLVLEPPSHTLLQGLFKIRIIDLKQGICKFILLLSDCHKPSYFPFHSFITIVHEYVCNFFCE